MPSSPLLNVLAVVLLALAPLPLRAQVTLSPPEAEIQKCEERIASVQRDVLGKYEDALGELQLAMQKAADLEGSLAVRSERQRVKTDQSLSEKDYVNEPKALRALQMQTGTKLRELITAVVQDAIPKLIEFKRTSTVAGKLDEAVVIRAAIERLQNAHVPIVRPDASMVTPAETLLLAYAGDRARADKTYKGQKISVRGVLGGYRPDPAESRNYQIYLSGSSGSGWVQCTLSHTDFRFREDKNPVGVVTLVVTTKDGESTARLLKGQSVEVRGVCTGLDEVVRLDRCELPR
jgi:hypothetical protein